MNKITYTVDVLANGNKLWYLNGELHREDGPAVECADEYREWWLNNKLHRADGPAVERADGTKVWYLDGQRHRADGPAVEFANGYKEWWLSGKRHREDEFLKRTKATTCEGKIVEVDGVKYRLTVAQG